MFYIFYFSFFIKQENLDFCSLHNEEGKYSLVNVTDAYCKNTIKTGDKLDTSEDGKLGAAKDGKRLDSSRNGKFELEIFTFSPPSAAVSEIKTLCEGDTAEISIQNTVVLFYAYFYFF